MRGQRIGLVAAAMAGLGLARMTYDGEDALPLVSKNKSHGLPVRPTRSYFTAARGASASINRHTGRPHENLREIARRQRQRMRSAAA